MSVKSDKWIKEMSIKYKMIDPFAPSQVRKDVISFGLSSYGYDVRIDDEFKIFNNKNNSVLDPKNFNNKVFTTKKSKYCIIPPHSYILAKSLEYFRIPRNIITICFGKSTYARCGVIINVTPFEPEWEGFVTMAISNTAPCPVKIYAGEGVAQVLFLESDEDCLTSYKDKKGKYQAQKKITTAKI